ncbi:unnamed protein product [Schistosoma turkestanicum]|nr:unnamed protein product [Schistosoma turkestanicum]
MCLTNLFHIIFLLSALHVSMQDALDPLPDINLDEMNLIESYSQTLYAFKFKSRYRTSIISDLEREKLRKQHRNTNDPIVKYMDCEMELQMNFQKSILMKDIIRTTSMEEDDFGVKLEKSSEKQVCFNHKQRTFDIKNQIDSHIRAFSISIRYYNYELFNFQLLSDIVNKLDQKYMEQLEKNVKIGNTPVSTSVNGSPQ